jgi:UDP-N-acetylmuramate dehydrogenase
MNWPRSLKVRANQPLGNYTTFRIGGAAQYFYEPDSRFKLKAAVILARKNKIPVHLLGAGSNLLVSDKGVRGLVLKLSAPCFKKIDLRNASLKVGAGVSLSYLLRFAQKNSLKGLEFLAGIPGSLGGAVAMNAGCWGFSVADLVKEVEIMDYNGNIRKIKRKQIKFSYRKSGLGQYIILGAVLALKAGSGSEIQSAIKGYLKRRRKSQDATFPNAGCIFKNPKGDSAGRLIDLCRLKGKAKGSAFISARHANFILNKGGASCADVLSLMDIVKAKVKDKFSIGLKPEIKLWK